VCQLDEGKLVEGLWALFVERISHFGVCRANDFFAERLNEAGPRRQSQLVDQKAASLAKNGTHGH